MTTSTTWDDFDPALDDFLAVEDLPDCDPGLIGEGDADRRLRAYSRIKAKMERNQATRDGQVAHCDQWLADQNGGLARRLAVLEGWLHNWMAVQLIRNPKTTTIELPAGKLVTRQANWSARIVDSQALLDWALATRPGLVTEPLPPPPSVKAGDVKKAADVVWDGETGRLRIGDEYVPGVTAVRSEGAERMGKEWRTLDIKVD